MGLSKLMQETPFTFSTSSARNHPPGRLRTEITPPRRSASVGFLVPVLAFIVLAYLSSANASFHTQIIVSLGLLALLFLARLFRESQFARVVFLSVSTFVILRYLFWRTLYTVEFTDWVSFTCAIILFLAEFYGILVALIGNFVNLSPLERTPVPLPPADVLPTVDVMVPSYNEGIDLIETTLMGAIQIQYPEGKKKVYLLDDGGTDQKCQKGTEASTRAARERRANLQQLCAELGVGYLTRPQNRFAKAGNINEAIQKTSGELIVILDADHVPTTDFLEKTVGFFLEDPKLFLVQTPHFFINPDPIERNLDTFQRMPGENEMFYREIQRGLDFWNSAFFCGSGAVLRRRIVQSIGGIATDTVTEDAETALVLHAKGYHSAYLASPPLLSGLAAETMSGFIRQRSRWAQGMIQIFLLKCPLFLPGLSFSQRLCYFNSCFFWAFPFARLVYMLAPAAFLVFGLRIYASNVETFCAYAIPYLLTMMATTHFLFGKARWSFVSELYELIQSIHTIPAIISTVFKPRSPSFLVTPKQETLNEDFISPIAVPFYLLAIVNFVSIGVGLYQFAQGSGHIYPLTITLLWSLFNTIILMAAMGALFERRQLRATPRTSVDIGAEMIVQGQALPCRIENLSLGGCRLFFPWGSEAALENRSEGILRVLLSGEQPPADFNTLFRNFRDEASSGFTLGVSFAHRDLEERKAKVRFVTGDSERWADFQKSRQSQLGILSAFFTLISIGFARFVPHLSQIGDDLFGSGKKSPPPSPKRPATQTAQARLQTAAASPAKNGNGNGHHEPASHAAPESTFETGGPLPQSKAPEEIAR